MILNTIEIQNFGIYNGCNELELTPRTTYNKLRPVVLIGGKNGAGKSTMFEAIKLCLYGKKSMQGKNSQKEYLDYLESRINWYSKDDESTFIKMSFSIFRDNIDPKLAKEYKYDLIREWYKSGNTIKEDFSIYQDNVLIELDSEFWEDFIEEIIPQGVIDLFFFDGEKIQELATGSNTELRNAIKALLNLSILPTLSNDLKGIYKKYVEQGTDKDSLLKIKNAEKELLTLEKEEEKLQNTFASKITKVNASKSKLETLEKKLKDIGGEYYEQREKLKTDESKCRSEIQSLNNAVAEDCGELIPFLLAPKLMNRISNQLDNELIINERAIATDILTKKKKELDSSLKSLLKNIDLTKSQEKEISSTLSGFTSSWITDSGEESKYKLTTAQINYSIQRLSQLKKQFSKTSEDYKQIESLHRRMSSIQRKIESASNDEVVINIHNEIKEQSTILGKNQKETDDLDDLLNKKRNEINLLSKSIEKLHYSADKADDQEKNFERIDLIRKVLTRFENELTKDKVSQLEDKILECYSLIHRKSGFIARVNIDSETFDVTMFDKTQKIIPVSKLSAGEKQVYATSVLWALSKLSGQSLPMVIDTPLGRLDSSHRNNLIENFFPNASHQVIILSTDTEIDENYFSKLEKSVSHTYSIDFNNEGSHSRVDDGYLFESQGGVQ